MANIYDAIFFMDDEVICTIKKPVPKKTEENISKSLPSETSTDVHLAKSPPINIVKPEKTTIKYHDDFYPSSPYVTI